MLLSIDLRPAGYNRDPAWFNPSWVTFTVLSPFTGKWERRKMFRQWDQVWHFYEADCS